MPDESKHDEDIRIALPTAVKGGARAVQSFIANAPNLVGLLLVVGSFIWYLHSVDARHSEDRKSVREYYAKEDADDSALDSLRIQTCHDVQERSILVMEAIIATRSLEKQSQDELLRAIASAEDSHALLRALMERLLIKIDEL